MVMSHAHRYPGNLYLINNVEDNIVFHFENWKILIIPILFFCIRRTQVTLNYIINMELIIHIVIRHGFYGYCCEPNMPL